MTGSAFRAREPARLAYALVASVALSCGTNNRSDAHCTPDAVNVDADTDCIYAGAGKAPGLVPGVCDSVTGKRPDDMDCPTFDDVFAVLVDAKKGNCSADACHGNLTNPAVGILLPADDKDKFYETLTTVTGTVGRRYVVPDDMATTANEALTSWIVCNLAADLGGGYPMPPPNGLYQDGNEGGAGGGGGGGQTSAAATTASTGTGMGGGGPTVAYPPDIALVRDWILCGAPPPMEPMPNP